MSKEILDREKIKGNGWKQGACLLVEPGMEIFIVTPCGEDRLSEGLYFILTQDCDILNPSLKKEPRIELILGKEEYQINSGLMWGKSPRQLHFQVNNAGLGLAFSPWDRFFIDRAYLEQFCSHKEKEIHGRNLKNLIDWVYKRYKRAALPDAFNERIDKVKKQIKQILGHESLQGILGLGLFIQLNTYNELVPHETYKLIVKLLVTIEDWNDQNELIKIQHEFDKILTIIDRVVGVSVLAEESQVQSMHKINLHDYLQLKQWDLDYLSFNSEVTDNTNILIASEAV